MNGPIAHDQKLRHGQWYACERPEAPFTPTKTVYDPHCRACLVAAKAALMNGFGGQLGYYSELSLADWWEEVEGERRYLTGELCD